MACCSEKGQTHSDCRQEKCESGLGEGFRPGYHIVRLQSLPTTSSVMQMNVFRGLNYKGKAMELSDLSEYNGHLLSPDDKTGIVYEIKDGKVTKFSYNISI